MLMKMMKLQESYNDLICPLCLEFKFQYLERLVNEEGEPTEEMTNPYCWESALMQGTCDPCFDSFLSTLK